MKKLLNKVLKNITARRIYENFISGCTPLTIEEPIFLDYLGNVMTNAELIVPVNKLKVRCHNYRKEDITKKKDTTITETIEANLSYLQIACEIYPDCSKATYIQQEIKEKYTARKKSIIEGKTPNVTHPVFVTPNVDQFIHKMLNDKKEG